MVIQNNVGNQYSPTVIVSAITSRTYKHSLPTHIVLEAEKYGLPKESIVLCEQLRTLDKSRLISKIGRVDAEKMNMINKAMAVSIGLKTE